MKHTIALLMRKINIKKHSYNPTGFRLSFKTDYFSNNQKNKTLC